MSGPAGSGSPQFSKRGAGFAAVVGKLRNQRKNGGSSSPILDDVRPSRGLPSTGLKRNTSEWRDEHRQNNGRKRRDSQSSSSSIPSNATGSSSGDENDQRRAWGQEGAEGRGPGKHERRIFDGRGQITESPTEDVGPANFLERSRPPNDGDYNFRKATALENGHSVERPLENGHGGGKRDGHVGHEGENGDGGESGDEGDNGLDPEEMMLGRLEGRNKGLTDEAGRMPEGLPGLKEEQSPGPRNEIVLDPRVSHIHVSRSVIPGFPISPADAGQYHQQREYTGKGVETGPILTVTADGEDEVTAGQTPGPSRQSSLNRADVGKGRKEGPGGSWTTAMNSQPRPPQPKRLTTRFSSFRQSHASSNRDREHESSDSNGHTEPNSAAHEAAHRRWSQLRARVLPARNQSMSGPTPGANKATALSPASITSVPITTELLAGQLPVMILKTWLDRDEDGNRAVPILLGNLRFRVGDSVGLRAGRETGKEMFKVECEYGDGVVKWVRGEPLH